MKDYEEMLPRGYYSGKNETVNHPTHYNAGKIECIDAANAMVSGYTDTIDACMSWQILKYLWRHPFKGNPVEDIDKLLFYANKLREHLLSQNA